MKRLSLIIILVWQSNLINAQTSVYHEFPDSNATWNVSWGDVGYGGCGEYFNSISNDTIINTLTYHKIVKKAYGFSWVQSPNYNPNYPYGNFVCDKSIAYGPSIIYDCSIREDVLQKKVYVIISGDTTEQLLYDFNLNVGDTLKGYLGVTRAIVLSVDSILINSEYRKQWNFTIEPNINNFQVIEGIGSTCGLAENFTGFEHFSILNCFSQNNQTLYPTYDATSECVFITSIAENKETENELSILPNPTTGKFQVKWNGIRANTLEITDVLGNKILEFAIKNNVGEVDLTSQHEGVYFVKIIDSSGNFAMEKIVKQ